MPPAVSIITPVKAKTDLQVQWLDEAIATVQGQSYSDWEMVIVDDQSPQYDGIDALSGKWTSDKITFFAGEEPGASACRNLAAFEAKAPLLLPLDADDKLSVNAVEVFLKAWQGRGSSRIIYSDVTMFGQDFAKVYLAPGYDFRTLLKATFMTVGCLHTKADWQKVGGWRQDMELGLEDWEYWIALAEIGACGKRVQEPLYWYRRHAHGRLAHLKQNVDQWQKAYQRMRELHRDTYNGRPPMGCCGGAAAQVGGSRPQRQAQAQLPLQGDRVPVAYIGRRQGDFWARGSVTGARYHVPGRGMLVEDERGHPGVDARDVPRFLQMQQGQSFKVLPVPKAAAPAPRRPASAPARPKESPAWDAGVMEEPKVEPEKERAGYTETFNVTELSLRRIKELEINFIQAGIMLKAEQEGKNRKTVVKYLQKIANG
jgi:hypothetical protein